LLAVWRGNASSPSWGRRVEQHEPGEARGTEESLFPPEKMSFFASARGKREGKVRTAFRFLLRARDFTIYPVTLGVTDGNGYMRFLQGDKGNR